MQINVEIQEEKIKKEVLSKLKSVRKILWKEKRSDLELEDALKKKFGLNKIISKLVKQRKESASIFKSKNRLDLEKEELSQIKYLEVYLPKQLSEDEIEEYISIKLNEIDNFSLKDMGRLMGLLMKELSGKADGKIISKILKRKLSE